MPCLLGSFSGRYVKASSKERGAFFCLFVWFFFGGGAFYNNPDSLLSLTPEIVDILFNAYQRDSPRKVDCVDEVERWKIRWDLVDDKPVRLLDTLNATGTSLFRKSIALFRIFVPLFEKVPLPLTRIILVALCSPRGGGSRILSRIIFLSIFNFITKYLKIRSIFTVAYKKGLKH